MRKGTRRTRLWSESGKCEFYDFQCGAIPENDQVQGVVTKLGE